MNCESSRSHLIIQIQVEITNKTSENVINLINLMFSIQFMQLPLIAIIIFTIFILKRKLLVNYHL